MSRNSLIFIGLLALLAVCIGYAKLVLVPNYNKTHPLTQSATPASSQTPEPSAVPMGDAIEAKKNTTAVVAGLSDSEKFAQLMAVSVQLPVSTASASLTTIDQIQPGVIILSGATSTASAQKAMGTLGAIVASKSATLALFATARPGKAPELCAYNEVCQTYLETLQDPPRMSLPLDASVSAQVAMSEFQRGSTILSLNPKMKTAQISALIDGLIVQYKSSIAFKQLIDGKVLQVVGFKQEYY